MVPLLYKEIIETHISTAKHFIKEAKHWKKFSDEACLYWLRLASEQIMMAKIYLK